MNYSKFSAGLRLIALGITAIAEGFEEDGVYVGSAEDKKAIADAKVNRADDKVREEMQKARDKAKEETEDDGKPPFEEGKTEEPPEPGDIALEDLQELGASLIRSGKRDDLKKVLADLKLKSLSSCPTEDFPKLWAALTEAGK